MAAGTSDIITETERSGEKQLFTQLDHRISGLRDYTICQLGRIKPNVGNQRQKFCVQLCRLSDYIGFTPFGIVRKCVGIIQNTVAVYVVIKNIRYKVAIEICRRIARIQGGRASRDFIAVGVAIVIIIEVSVITNQIAIGIQPFIWIQR